MTRSHDHLARLDARHLWHPFTPNALHRPDEAFVICQGDGVTLTDDAGNNYIDGTASLWCNVFGHRRREIDEAVRRQLDHVAHSTLLGMTHPAAVELAERLVAAAPPGLTRVYYSDSGATAVEVALKMAMQACRLRGHRKHLFMSLDGAYHGDTLGAVSVGNIEVFHEVFRPLLFETVAAPQPYCYRCPLGLEPETCATACLAAFEKLIRQHHHELVAVVLEPGAQGAAGMIPLPEGYLARVRALCDELDVYLIADEVAMGMGRTGRMFACDHEEVTPDFLCLGKGLSGGYLPLAATLTTEAVFDVFDDTTLYHGHTCAGNPLGWAAACATLELFESTGLLAELPRKVEFMQHQLERFAEMPMVGDIRSAGFFAGIELVRDRDTREPYPPEIKHQVTLEARKRGLISRGLVNTCVVMPALVMDDDTLVRLLDRLQEAIVAACREVDR